MNAFTKSVVDNRQKAWKREEHLRSSRFPGMTSVRRLTDKYFIAIDEGNSQFGIDRRENQLRLHLMFRLKNRVLYATQ